MRCLSDISKITCWTELIARRQRRKTIIISIVFNRPSSLGTEFCCDEFIIGTAVLANVVEQSQILVFRGQMPARRAHALPTWWQRTKITMFTALSIYRGRPQIITTILSTIIIGTIAICRFVIQVLSHPYLIVNNNSLINLIVSFVEDFTIIPGGKHFLIQVFRRKALVFFAIVSTRGFYLRGCIGLDFWRNRWGVLIRRATWRFCGAWRTFSSRFRITWFFRFTARWIRFLFLRIARLYRRFFWRTWFNGFWVTGFVVILNFGWWRFYIICNGIIWFIISTSDETRQKNTDEKKRNVLIHKHSFLIL